MHTPLCGHAVGDPVQFVEAAARKGLKKITFTCHIPLLPDETFGGPGIRMRESQLPLYRRMVEAAARRGEKLGVEVYRGIEAEIYPDAEVIVQVQRILQQENFDFVLGSLHHQISGYRDWLDDHDLMEDSEVIRTYFQQLTEGVRSGIYDSIAHPDVIRIYGTVEPFEPEEYQEEIEQFLDALVEEDHCMEVNTSGLIKGVYEVHPAPSILAWACQKGVRLTLGSDAHAARQVGQKFKEVGKLLRAIGFEKLHYFVERQRYEYSLVD